MRSILSSLILLFIAGIFNFVSAQKNVEVNLLTGTAQIIVPIHTVNAGDISVPVALSYRTSGLKVSDYDQRVGQGWTLIAEAAITRNARGFPDDVQYQANGSFPIIKGWVRATDMGTKVENFTIANDNNSNTCADEVTDYSYMNTNFSDNHDTEPDIFMVNAPGLSLQFFFDKNQQIKVYPYRDVTITYTTDGNGLFTSFTVTNNKGIKYIFDKKSLRKQSITDNLNPSTMDAYKRNYMFFRRNISDAEVQFYWKWYVSSITDTKGNKVLYTYEDADEGSAPKANEKIEIIKYNPSTSVYFKQYLYTNTRTITEQRMTKITSVPGGTVVPADGDVEFTWNGIYSESSLSSIVMKRAGQGVDLNFSLKLNKNNNQSNWGRIFLKGLTFRKGSGATIGEYKFKYMTVNFDDLSSYLYTPDSITNAQDYWGYYNGYTANTSIFPPVWVYPDNASVDKFRIKEIPGYGGNVIQLTGAERSVNFNAAAGTLTQITYPSGGVTAFEYELQEYLDKDINAAVTGGGVRVKKITHNDGLNTNDVTFYEYNDPSTSVTTGRAISLPKFAFAFGNTTSYGTLAERVKNCTYRSCYDFSEESKEIIYGKVTVRKTNGGKSVYEFNTSGTWGSTSINEWSEVTNYVTRLYTSTPSPCNALLPDFLTNGKNYFPFSINTNFDFERGLLNRILNYNEAGNLISQEDYTYQRSHTPSQSVQALKFDNVTGVRAYVKYNVLATIDNLFAAKSVKTYSTKSPYDPNVYTTETESFSYLSGSNDHRLPVIIQKINSDGMISRHRIKYVKDYITTGSGDAMEQAIHNLKSKNNNVPVEVYETVETAGVEKAISGNIAVYGAFLNSETSLNMYLPSENWKFTSASGVTSFPVSSISSGNFAKYSGYYKQSSILGYDFSGTPLSIIDNSRIAKTTLQDPYNSLSVSEFKNAKPAEIIHTTYDYYNPLFALTVGGNSTIEPGHLSKACLSFQTSTNLTGSISNAETNTDIIFSCWLKDASSSGTITIALTATGFSGNYYISFTAHSDWRYYQVKIPKPNKPSLNIGVSTNVSLKLDDVLMYPANASVKTSSYSIKNYTSGLKGIVLSAETGMGGYLTSYDVDAYGRPLFVRDQDNNILEMKLYKRVHSWESITAPTITWPTPAYKDASITFTAWPVIPYGTVGVMYIWNFGDGSGNQTTFTNTKDHTYTATGTYTVTCQVSAPGYTTVTSNNHFASITNPPPPPITALLCAAGIVEKTPEGDCILEYCDDPAVCYNTKFKIAALIGCSPGDIQTYTWEKAVLGSDSWSTVGTSSSVTINFTSAPSYQIRCRIHTYDGRDATSDVFTVYNNYD